jgi:ATP-binding cassette subfamily B protein
VRQYDQADCGPAALLSVLRWHGGNTSVVHVRSLTNTDARGSTMLSLVEAALALGLTARGARGGYEDLMREQMPCIAHVITEAGLQHFLVVYRITARKVLVGDPALGRRTLSREAFLALWRERSVVLLAPTDRICRRPVVSAAGWIAAALEGHRAYLSQALFLGAVYAIAGLLTAVFVQSLIDRLIPEHRLDKILLTGGALLAVQLLRAAAGYLRQRFLVELNRRVSSSMAERFLGHVFRLPLGFFESRKTGDITSRLNDTVRIQAAILRVIGGTAIDLLMVLGALVFAFALAEQIGWIALASLPLYGVLLAGLTRRVSDEHAQVMGSLARLEAAYIDSLRGIDAVMSFNAAAPFTARLNRLNLEYQDRNRGLGNTQASAGLKAELAGGALMVVALITGAALVIDGEMKLGAMMAAYSLMATMFPAINRLVEANIVVQGAKVAASRLLDLLLVPPEADAGGESREFRLGDGLHITRGRFVWPRGRVLFDDLTLSVPRGRITALWGDSGSGKSTLVKILERKYTLGSGSLMVGDVPADSIALAAYRRHVAVVPETVTIFNGTLLDNILLGRSVPDIGHVERFVLGTGLGPFVARFEGGLGTLVGEDGRQLSSGERQVIGLLRALLDEPAVLVVDEGVNAVDLRTVELVMQAITRYAGGHAVLIISHNLATLQCADRVYVLEQGTLAAACSPADLFDALRSRRSPDVSAPFTVRRREAEEEYASSNA